MTTNAPALTPSAPMDQPELTRQRLTAWFGALLPQARELHLSELRRPGAGISNETYFVDLHWREGTQAVKKTLVLRWPPQGFTNFPRHAYDMGRQHQLLQALAGTAVPVAPVVGVDAEGRVLGTPFYVMEKVDGWVPSDFPPYHVAGPLFEASEAEREQVWWNAVDTIARIHAVDWRSAGLGVLGVPGPGSEFMQRQIAWYDEVFAQNGEPMPPLLARTRAWLLAHAPTPKTLALCWGDARLGNLMLQGLDITAVLDWEMACIGDPESDLGWFAHIDWATSVGRARGAFPRMAGLPDMAQTVARYTQITGRPVDNLFYYETFATWRLAILFSRMEQDPNYIARSGNAKGFITGTHFEKLARRLDERA